MARLRARLVSSGWQAADIDLFLADFANNADALAKFDNGVLDPQAWKALKDRPQMRTDVAQLTAATKCLSNPKLKAIGIDEQAMGDIMTALKNDYATYGNTVKALDDEMLITLANFGEFLNNNPTSQFNNFAKVISDLKGGGFPNRKGSHWILKNISQDATTFGGKKVTFNTTQTVNGTNYYVDVEVDGDFVKFLEYKSGPNTIQDKDEFLREFVKRDLSNQRVSSLSQIEWRKDVADPTLKSRINGWLNSTEGRTELKKIDAAKANQLLGRTDLSNLDKDAIADAFISHLDDLNNFQSIFK
ncbi:MAG: hypothetical protein MUF12_09815 [Sediminibacterium sp.]|nr:hypothetical protein [Sediminibacterium sp.]